LVQYENSGDGGIVGLERGTLTVDMVVKEELREDKVWGFSEKSARA